MALRSSLVTCPSNATVKGLVISGLPSTVNVDMLVVDKKASNLYECILAAYEETIAQFNNLASDYEYAAKKATGKMKNAYKKVATNCKEQANQCRNRMDDLTHAFEFNQLEAKVAALEAALLNNN